MAYTNLLGCGISSIFETLLSRPRQVRPDIFSFLPVGDGHQFTKMGGAGYRLGGATDWAACGRRYGGEVGIHFIPITLLMLPSSPACGLLLTIVLQRYKWVRSRWCPLEENLFGGVVMERFFNKKHNCQWSYSVLDVAWSYIMFDVACEKKKSHI